MIRILDLLPAAAIPGGELFIRCGGLELKSYLRPEVRMQRSTSHLVSAASDLIVTQVPSEARTGDLWIAIDGQESNHVTCEVADLVTDNLHPVANPVLDAGGNLYSTVSGRKGEKVPNSIFKVSRNGVVEPLGAEIVNPTGLALNSRDELFVSSRQDGNIFRVSARGEATIHAKGMGVATDIAFDREDNLYVGDRSGTIFKIDRNREIFVFATLEPSVSAYHLAFDQAGSLFVTGPTASTCDHVYKVTASGEVEVFFTGLGRPQGLAFDVEGNLHVAASLAGRRGVVKINPDGKASLAVSGSNLIGLAFGYGQDVYLASTSSIYRIHLGVEGKPLP